MDIIKALQLLQIYAQQDIITHVTISQHASGRMLVTAYSPDLDIIAKDTGVKITRFIDAGAVQIKEIVE